SNVTAYLPISNVATRTRCWGRSYCEPSNSCSGDPIVNVPARIVTISGQKGQDSAAAMDGDANAPMKSVVKVRKRACMLRATHAPRCHPERSRGISSLRTIEIVAALGMTWLAAAAEPKLRTHRDP